MIKNTDNFIKQKSKLIKTRITHIGSFKKNQFLSHGLSRSQLALEAKLYLIMYLKYLII